MPTLADSPADQTFEAQKFGAQKFGAQTWDSHRNRRDVLRLGGAAVGIAAVVTAVGACGSADSGVNSPAPDPLVALSVAARRDVESAIAAIAVAPERAAALSVVADQRSAHADALRAEVTRLDPTGTSNSGTSNSGTSNSGTSATGAPVDNAPAAGPPPSLDDVRSALQSSARTAADTARSLTGYRAGLVGSISAACSVHVSVVLA